MDPHQNIAPVPPADAQPAPPVGVDVNPYNHLPRDLPPCYISGCWESHTRCRTAFSMREGAGVCNTHKAQLQEAYLKTHPGFVPPATMDREAFTKKVAARKEVTTVAAYRAWVEANGAKSLRL